MPGLADKRSDKEIWQILHCIRAENKEWLARALVEPWISDTTRIGSALMPCSACICSAWKPNTAVIPNL